VTVGYERLVRGTLSTEEAYELARVDELAQELREHLEASSGMIDAAHVHLAPSGAIQSIASVLLREKLGFEEEKRFDDVSLSARPRPDFIFHLADRRGILAEVERAGRPPTTTT
jgi:hypothetical protein